MSSVLIPPIGLTGGGGGGGGPSGPPEYTLPVTSGLQGHWMSDVGVTEDGFGVTEWADQSGNGNDWVQSSDTKKPDYATQPQLNGRDVLSFNGVTGEHEMEQTGFISGMSDGEIFFMHKRRGSGNEGFSKFGSNSAANHYPHSGNIWDDFGSTSRRNTSAPSETITDVWHVYNAHNGSTWRSYINGIEHYNAGGNTNGWNGTFYIGGSGGVGGAINWEGDIAEIIIYDRVLSSTEREDVLNYLTNKYEIAPRNEGLVGHWQAQRGITITGSGISTWADQSGNGNDWGQSVDGRRPVVVSEDLNGYDVIQFDGTDDELDQSAFLSGTNDGEIFAVFIDEAPTQTTFQVHWHFVPGGNADILHFTDGNTYEGFARTSRIAFNMGGVTVGAGYGIYNVYGEHSGDHEISWNNVSERFQSGGNSVGWNTVFNLGGGAGFSFDGKWAEVLVFDRVLTAAERTVVNRYLDRKYNLGIGV